MKRTPLFLALSCGLWLSAPALALEDFDDEPEPDAAAPTTAVSAVPAPEGLGFELGTGLYGSLSFFEAGVIFPQLFPNMRSSLKLVGMSSITWASFTNLETGESVSLHPMVFGGVFSIGGHSPMYHGFMRVYGGAELLLGTTLTLYDSYFYERDNLIGDNVTYGVFGFFGAELFTSPHGAFFVEGGGGFKSLRVAEENAYAVTSAWLGSGVTLRVGSRFFL